MLAGFFLLATVNALRARGPRDSLLVTPLDPNSLRTQVASAPSPSRLLPEKPGVADGS